MVEAVSAQQSAVNTQSDSEQLKQPTKLLLLVFAGNSSLGALLAPH